MDFVPRESFPKCYPVISPSLMKLEWGDPLKFQFNSAFDLGFPEFTDPDLKHHAKLLDGISDLDVLFDDDPLKPELPPSNGFKHCAYAEEPTSSASAFKDVTNHKRFGHITTSSLATLLVNCTINVSLKYICRLSNCTVLGICTFVEFQ